MDLSPLADSQIAPLGFLWSEWLVTRLAGTGELALRFIPLVASVIALLSFARLAGRLLDARLALLATALAAVSPLLIYYSAEVKPYAFDWMLSVLLMLATLDIFEDPSPRHWQRWAVVAALSALFSVSAPFYVAGSALALLAHARTRDRGRGIWRILAASLPAAAIAVVHYLRWHPDRLQLGGSTGVTGCEPRGTRTVVGEWPQFVGTEPGAATSGQRVIRPEWLEAEGARILARPAEEITLLFGYLRELRETLPAWLEMRGATRLAREENHPLLRLRYRPPRQ